MTKVTLPNNPIMKNIILLLSLLVVLISCSKDEMNGDVVTDSKLLETLKQDAQDTINVDNQYLVLQAELYRDFFPGTVNTKTKRRLTVSIYIMNTDSAVISKTFEIKTLYVINNESIWISTPGEREENSTPVYKRHYINGPEWETNINVDVVVAIQDKKTGITNYLQARNHLIQRLD